MEKIKTVTTGFKQMLILVDASVYLDMKKRALDRGTSLKGWVMQAVAEKMAREDRVK